MAYKVLLGDHLSRTRDHAVDLWGDHCKLLTWQNHEIAISQAENTNCCFYTGLGDWDGRPEQLLEVLSQADQVVIAPFATEGQIDQFDPTATDAGIVRVLDFMLDRVSGKTQFCPQSLLALSDMANQRFASMASSRTLWAFGCSMTAGLEVDEHQRWTKQLSDRVNLPVRVVAEPGSSIAWAADKILRSDIKCQDIVIWALTEVERFTWYVQDHAYHVHTRYIQDKIDLPQLPNKQITAMLASDHLFHSAIFLINQVENFCNKIGARLIIFGMLSSDALNLQLCTKSNFIPYFRFHKNYIDRALDNLHPGPQEHKLIAQFLHNKLNQHQYI